eukprot:4624119-Lingulodinium_polyedra.AAC.1
MTLPRGTLVQESGQLYMSLGPVGYLATLALPVKEVKPRLGGETFYSLEGAVCPGAFHWFCLPAPEDTMVVPCQPMSPTHQFLAQGRKLQPDLGLLWKK